MASNFPDRHRPIPDSFIPDNLHLLVVQYNPVNPKGLGDSSNPANRLKLEVRYSPDNLREPCRNPDSLLRLEECPNPGNLQGICRSRGNRHGLQTKISARR